MNEINTLNAVCELTKLPSADEYEKRDKAAIESYFEWSSRKFSEPKYLCPKCKEGGMCRDETVVLTTLPPTSRYECNKCHHVAYHHI